MLGAKYIFIVALGGALGSAARFKFGGLVLHHTPPSNFPVGTFSVNVLGCFAIGLLAALAEHHDFLAPATRAFLFTGVLGGFTTFSAFGYESVSLLRRGLLQVSLFYIMASVVAGLASVAAGMKLLDVLWPPRH